MKDFLKQIYAVWRACLTNPKQLARLFPELAAYRDDLKHYRSKMPPAEQIEIRPVLFQKGIPSSFDAHYVYQSAWAMRRIAALKPSKHTDISSNIPYVTALSAIVPVDFYEFRPPLLKLAGLSCQKGDLSALPFANASVSSISCLHVLEHLGLGRYGDPVDPVAMENGVKELGRVLADGGNLFLSIPVGRERTQFNMHRVSAPDYLVRILEPHAKLKEFSLVDDQGSYHENCSLEAAKGAHYACGLYWFEGKRRN